MENEILQLAASQGLWAVMFVVLLFYVLKENSTREEKFQEIISNLTERLDALDILKKDVDEIKENLQKISISK
ncbi:MAG: bacteriocin [Peptococcaceae bacterium]|nr:bacteriocin [Peptococcaceae bacterium]